MDGVEFRRHWIFYYFVNLNCLLMIDSDRWETGTLMFNNQCIDWTKYTIF